MAFHDGREKATAESLEAAYAMIINELREGVALFEPDLDVKAPDYDFRLADANAAFYEAFGEVRDALLGKAARSVFRDAPDEVLALFAMVCETGVPRSFALPKAGDGGALTVRVLKAGPFLAVFTLPWVRPHPRNTDP